LDVGAATAAGAAGDTAVGGIAAACLLSGWP